MHREPSGRVGLDGGDRSHRRPVCFTPTNKPAGARSLHSFAARAIPRAETALTGAVFPALREFAFTFVGRCRWNSAEIHRLLWIRLDSSDTQRSSKRALRGNCSFLASYR